MTRDGTAEPVSRDQILRHVRGQENINFPCSADHEQDWQSYLVDPYSAITDYYTYIHIHTYISRYTHRSIMFIQLSIYLALRVDLNDRQYSETRNLGI